MSLKRKTTLHKYEGEYQSPDGEVYDCIITKHGERCYIQWQLQTGDDAQVGREIVTVDAAMLEGLYEWYIDITGRQIVANKASISSGGRARGLRPPNVTDHRGPQGVAAHSQVKESMQNYDDNVVPVQSFSPPLRESVWDGAQGTAEMRSGIDPSTAAMEAPDTPDPWKLDNPEEEYVPQWKKEAQERDAVDPPTFVKKGSIGERVKRVGAGDIL